MCGIAGFLTLPTNSGWLQSTVASMAEAIAHRGPDDAGTWTDATQGLAFAHRRLSIVDLSPAGHQPMVSRSGRFVISFNGEIYNHLALRRLLDLPRAGTPATAGWRGRSDTETLLACIETFGVKKAIGYLSGMFAFAVWDRDALTLTLARDGAGEKPLYYGWQRGTFLFASELSALRRHPSFQEEIDRGALGLLLKHNYVPGPLSIYAGIRKLQPGCLLQLSAVQRNADGTPAAEAEVFEYFSMIAAAESGSSHPYQGSEDEALEELETRLSTAVRSQMMSDVPLGALLSGGVDSTLVTALMQKNSAQPIRTFTVGFDVAEYDEAEHARAVARHLGTHHTELRLTGSDALAVVPDLARIYDEPFADSSQLPTHLVMKMARNHVKVALSGDGADELFGGYNRYTLVPEVWRRTHWLPDWSRRALANAILSVPTGAINRWSAPFKGRIGVGQLGDKAHKLAHRLHHAGSIADLHLALVSEWIDTEQSVIGDNTPSIVLSNKSRWPAMKDPVLRMMGLDAATYLPDDILVKVDRAAMSVSLETRAPFLDPDVVKFAWSLPVQMKIRSGRGKWLLRRLLDRCVPPSLTERPKMGFGIPLDEWLRGPLRPWAEALLSEHRIRRDGYFDPVPIRAAWAAHLSGRSHGYRLWSVLMFQAWLEKGT